MFKVGVGHVRHISHVRKFCLGCTGVPCAAVFCLNCSLVVNVPVPFAHGIFILVAYDEVVHYARITFPKDLNTIRACETVSTQQTSLLGIENSPVPGF